MTRPGGNCIWALVIGSMIDGDGRWSIRIDLLAFSVAIKSAFLHKVRIKLTLKVIRC
jgi:hypothetical protein